MNISANGIKILKRIEGTIIRGGRHVIYDDQTGRPIGAKEPLPFGATIGYGHLIKPGEDFRNGITESAATELLRSDIAMAESAVRDNIMVSLSQNQYDALVLLAYNIGTKNFANSTVVKYINNSEYHNLTYTNLAAAWRAWNRSNGRVVSGLVQRRDTELNLFFGTTAYI